MTAYKGYDLIEVEKTPGTGCSGRGPDRGVKGGGP